jgi:hypothetical protein
MKSFYHAYAWLITIEEVITIIKRDYRSASYRASWANEGTSAI